MKRISVILLLALASVAAGAQVYVATDKACYVAGDRIWCSVFCAPGPAVAYLELCSQEGTAARTRIALDGGRGGGSLLIPAGTPTGNYMLAAYTAGSEPSGPVLSVYNTLGTARVKDGVVVAGDGESLPEPSDFQTGYGFALSDEGALVLSNTSGAAVSFCVSLYRADSLPDPAYRSISGFVPGPAAQQEEGEVLCARLAGADARAVAEYAELNTSGLVALLSAPGAGDDCYSAQKSSDGLFRFRTMNIYGDRDVVCMLEDVDPASDCHLELVSPFRAPAPADLPALRLHRGSAGDLGRRTESMLKGLASDTLAVTLPMRSRSLLPGHECVRYILDDYTRFPTMEEVFVEITPNVKMRMRKGATQVYVLLETPVSESVPVWGEALAMIDGVPVPDHGLIRTYDPAIVKAVEVYPYRYNFGGSIYGGVLNLVTFKGNMPGVLFDDNVRIYSFEGCAWPEEHRGAETLYWHPLLTLGPGESVEVPSGAMEPGVRYVLCAEGLAAGGRPVSLKKSFVR